MAGGIELGTAYVQIVPSLRGASKSIEDQLGAVDAKRPGKKLGASLGDGIGEQFERSGVPRVKRTFSDAIEQMGSAAQDLGGRLSSVGGALTMGLTLPLGAAAASAGAFALKTATSAETAQTGFETMLGSAEAAKKMMGDLADFAARTPFELAGLQQSAKQMMAYGFAAEDVIPMLQSVGDATAALGSGQAGIEQVTRALGQMRAKGKVSAEEMLQLTEAGIPAWEFLAEAIGTDTAGAMAAVSKGAVAASTGIRALTQGMDREFGGLMEKQAKTIPGIMSNIADSIQQPLMALKDTTAYDSLAEALAEVADAAGPFVESLLPHLEGGMRSVAKVVEGAAKALEGFSRMSFRDQQGVLKLAAAAVGAGPALKVMGEGLKLAGGAAKLAARGINLGRGAADRMGAAAKGAASLVRGLATGTEGAGIAAKLAAGGMTLLKGALPIAALSLATAAIGSVVGKMREQREHADLVAAATESMGSMNAQAAGAVEGMGTALGGMATDADGALRALAGLNDEYKDTMTDLAVKSTELDGYVGTIEELGGKSALTASEQSRLKEAVKGYNDITGDSIEITDLARGSLSKTKDEIKKNADAWRDNAKAQAMQELATKYLKQQIEGSMELESATAELQRRQGELDAARERGAGLPEMHRLTKAVEEQQQEVNDLGVSVRESGWKYEELSGMATASMAELDGALKGALTDLPPVMQAKGTDIATKLSDGIKAGRLTTEQAVTFMSSGVMAGVQNLPPQMQERGMEAAAMLAQGVADGKLTVDQAATVLAAAARGDTANLPPEMQAIGGQVAQALGDGMSLNAALAGTGANMLGSSVTGAVAGIPPMLGTVGAAGAQGLAGALAAGVPGAAAAGGALKGSAEGGAAGLTASLGATGSSAGANLAGGLRANVGAAGAAGGALSSASQSAVAGVPGAMGSKGSQASGQFARGIQGGVGATGAAAQANAAAAERMNSGNSYSWGSEMGNNFANGIRGAIGAVAGAAKSLAGAVADFLHFTEPDKGPLVGINQSGYEMAQNYASAMMRGRGLVERASESLADAARFEGGGTVAVQTGGAARTAGAPSAATSDVIAAAEMVIAALPRIISDNTPVMGRRDFTRAVNKAVTASA